MRLIKTAIAVAFAASASAVTAQPTDAEIIQRVRNVAANNQMKEILSVEGVTQVDDNVLFLENLKFEDGGELELRAGNYQEIFLLAKEVRLNGPSLKAFIRFYDRDPIAGQDAPPPPGRPAKKSRSSGNGDDGINGQTGSPGSTGVTRQLPTLYIVADEFQVRKDPHYPNEVPDIRIYLDGIDGGTGGRGGTGQAGQHGQDGRHGEANHGICSKGPRSGGDGGDGGAFGKGGAGGDGGDGGSIIFIVSPRIVDDIKDIRWLSRGGLPGRGGLNGEGGAPGDGGSRGERPGTCSGASKGSGGNPGPSPAPNSRGPDGSLEGARGTVKYIEYDDVASLFNP